MLPKRCFDFAELDAVATNLYLIVDSADKLNIAVRQVPRKVSRPVQPRSRFITQWTLDEIPSAVSSGRFG